MLSIVRLADATFPSQHLAYSELATLGMYVPFSFVRGWKAIADVPYRLPPPVAAARQLI